MLRSKIILCLTILFSLTLSPLQDASAQLIRNGEFDQELNWWFPFGPCELEVVDDAYEGETACRVSNRTAQWNGLGQSIQGQFEAGVDYHVQAWVKLPPEQSGTMGIRLYQTDERPEERSLRIGEAIVGPDEWTLLQGAFTYDPHGEVSAMFLSFETSFTDGGSYDFLIDSISITESTWREAADERIEQIRKRDAVINVVDADGAPAANFQVNAVQVSQAFPFGSALNGEFLADPNYEDFFKDHFNFATTEWRTQWYSTEEEQGIEDYSIADAALAYCEEHGIPLKGHALFWGQETTRPIWLTDLSDAELQAAAENRVNSAVTHFGSRFFGWDVNNEMLNFDFFQDRLGPTTRSWMFQSARELNPDIQLFLNEYDLAVSEAKAVRYRALADSLIAEGADVSGVGYQSHFDGRVSPKGMEIGLKPFEDSGLGIWFTEFDSTHPDPERRADSLEDFYRYAFSRPEAEGIIMWGFWAGRHWRGPEASIVDLDWTINAAGERYFALMDEWTTETEGSSNELGQYEFRGFHGSYLLTTTDESDIVNYHLIPLTKSDTNEAAPEVTAAEFTVTASDFHESLTIHGTAEDDLFEVDLATPGQVVINGQQIALDFDIPPSRLMFESQGGQDRLVITTSGDSNDFTATGVRLLDRKSDAEVRFGDIASVAIHPADPESRVYILDSSEDDILESFTDVSILKTATQEISLHDFTRVFAFSSFGTDKVSIFDSSEIDKVWTNFNLLRIDSEGVQRRFIGFEDVEMTSSSGLDRLILRSFANSSKTYEVTPTSIDVLVKDSSERRFSFTNFPSVIFLGSYGGDDQVQVIGDERDETLRIIPNGTLYFGNEFKYFFNRFFRNFESQAGSEGYDCLIYRDSSADETVRINGDHVEISSENESHSFHGFERAVLFSNAGGKDKVSLIDASSAFLLIGDWLEQVSSSAN